KYGSGMLTPLINSNSLMLLNKGKEVLRQGEHLKIILFDTGFCKNNRLFNV
ncbi:MAG: molybdopterin molybdenumtransferase MoeA, partial [Epsilonproteobacteria bacterium]|nr:molybdopterin molybdenumtransferase MoeA [Campylobacterota bacterium]